MEDSTVKITVTAIDGASKVFEGVGDIAVKEAKRAAGAWIKANEVQNVSIQSTGQLASATANAAAQQDKLTASTKRSYFAQTALTTVLSAGINKAFLEMIDVTGQAIQRVDLLANFPKSMQALGLSASDASASLKILTGYIGQIGGNLQDATTSVTRFAEVTKDVKAATAEFIGVNNALLAGGASEQVQKNALEQLIQAYSRGVPQLIEWRSLMVAMPAQLNLVAKAMGFINGQALGEALTNGKVSMQEFMTELTKLSTGTGPIVAQAYARMNGIQFAFNVFKNTLVAGMTSIIQTVGRQNIIDFFNVLTGVVTVLAQWGVKLISILLTLFNVISGVFGGPQLKLAKDDTGGIADNLGAGADSAGDMADNLDDASDAAKKTANQLASFDKMNVLTSDKSKSKTNVAPGLDAATAATLGNIFDNIKTNIVGASTAAKVLAGIIAGFAGIKFAQNLLNQFNGLVKTIDDAGSNLDRVAKKILGVKDAADKTPNAFQRAGGALTSFASSLGNIASALYLVFSKSQLGQLVSRFAKFFVGPVIAAARSIVGPVVAIIGGLAEALAIPFELAAALVVAAIAAIAVSVYFIVKYWDTIWAAIKTAAIATWEFLIKAFVFYTSFVLTIYGGLITGIYTIFKDLGKWFYNNVISPVADFFKVLWEGVELATYVFVQLFKVAFNTLATWVYQYVVQPIAGFFVGLWNGLKTLFTPLAEFFQLVFLKAWLAIQTIFSPVGGWFSARWAEIKAVFAPVGDYIGNAFQSAWNNIVRIFAGAARWFGDNVVAPIQSAFSRIGDGVAGAFKGAMNALIDVANTFLNAFNKNIDRVNSVLHTNVGHVTNIPRLATGGVVNQATMLVAGEQGSEAIVPLENNTEWIDKLASKINGGGQKSTNSDVIPVTNTTNTPSHNITINVSGVFATSTQEQKKVAELIARQLNTSLKSKGLQGVY